MARPRSKSPATPKSPSKPRVVHNILDRKDRPRDLHDFLWTAKDEPHASRRKALMADHGETIRPLMGHEWRTKYVVVVLVS
jgi:hypothetical protein